MADVLKIALLIIGSQMMIVSFWLIARALMPGSVDAAQKRIQIHPIRTSVGGVIKGGVPLALGLAALNVPAPAVKILGFLLVSVVVIVGLLGSAGLAQSIGQGLARPLDEAEPWRPILRGGTVLVLALLLPFAGWFMLLPLMLIAGTGALLSRSPAGENAMAPVVATVATGTS